MKHWHKDAQGNEHVERVDTQPEVLTPEELAAREAEAEHRGGGGGATAAHDAPPAEGPEVAVDPHWSNLKLPEHPRGEGWIMPDPSKPIWPKE